MWRTRSSQISLHSLYSRPLFVFLMLIWLLNATQWERFFWFFRQKFHDNDKLRQHCIVAVCLLSTWPDNHTELPFSFTSFVQPDITFVFSNFWLERELLHVVFSWPISSACHILPTDIILSRHRGWEQLTMKLFRLVREICKLKNSYWTVPIPSMHPLAFSCFTTLNQSRFNVPFLTL